MLALDDDHSSSCSSVRSDRSSARHLATHCAAAARARRDGRAGAAARVLRTADRSEAGAPARADDHPDDLRTASPTTASRRRRRSDLAALAPHSCAPSACTRDVRLRSFACAAAIELERLHDSPTAVVAARLGRERGLGPWSIGVVCLEGLGRYDYGLVGDLGLVKLLRELRGREVEGWETAELLAPYGEWAGLASMYMLAGYSRG